MTYQTILANLSNEATAATVLNVADKLAERHLAHLLGMHVRPVLNMPVYAEIPITPELTQQFMDQQRGIENRVKEVFEQITCKSNYVAEWRRFDADMLPVADRVVEQGNTSDLILLGQNSPELAASQFRHFAEHVMLACGRPVLVVPWQHEARSVAERVMLAWDGRRESTRAVFGALPMLRHASEVKLHRINLPHQDRHHVVGTTEDLANTLSRHGVGLEVQHSDARGGEIAEELLGFARDMDADTLVMGCYGHSRIREFLLGGTTRQVFADATIPILMSN